MDNFVSWRVLNNHIKVVEDCIGHCLILYNFDLRYEFLNFAFFTFYLLSNTLKHLFPLSADIIRAIEIVVGLVLQFSAFLAFLNHFIDPPFPHFVLFL